MTMNTQPPERVLYFGFRRPLNQEALRAALGRRRPTHVGLISRSNFLGALADEFVDAKHGFRSCTFATNTFRAFPSAAFLQRMQPRETVILRMFERIFRGFQTGQDYELRKRLYLEQVAWAYGLLVDRGYQEVIFSEIPHHPFPYILHSVARELGLKARFFAQVQVKDTYVLAESIEEMFEPIRHEYDRMRAQGEVEELGVRLQRERERRSGRHKPFYMGLSDLTWRRKLYQWTKKHLRADDRLRLHRTLRNGWAYWRARRPLPAAQERFVYFPLHLQPEATTSPMGGVFVDQYLAIEMLARALPDGWKIVVKENPAQQLAKRDYGFYEQLAKMPQVHLVSRKASTFDLMERCEAVAAITGTAGWEALFKGKPVLVFGRAFYRGAPGTLTVSDVPSLSSGLQEILEGRFHRCTASELDRFLGAIQRCSIEGVVDTQYLRDSEIAYDESVRRHTEVLADLLHGRAPGWLVKHA